MIESSYETHGTFISVEQSLFHVNLKMDEPLSKNYSRILTCNSVVFSVLRVPIVLRNLTSIYGTMIRNTRIGIHEYTLGMDTNKPIYTVFTLVYVYRGRKPIENSTLVLFLTKKKTISCSYSMIF